MAETSMDPVTSSTRLVAIGDQITSDMGEECVILNLGDGVYYGLDGVGNRVWSLLAEPHTVGEICATIVGEYDVSAEDCEAAVIKLVEDLKGRNLVQIAG